MTTLRKHIPNLLSLCNAFFGGLAIYFITKEMIDAALWCMVGSIACDFCDGLAARRLKAFSPLGKDIDSLCDAVSFGVVPATLFATALSRVHFFAPWLAYLIVPASVYRLAKFNHDLRQSDSFIGLPTPANALFMAGLSALLIRYSVALTTLPRMIEYKVQAGYFVLILILGYLLISEVPMFGLKKIGRSTSELIMLIIVAVTTLGSILWLGWGGLAPGFGLYILLNAGHHLTRFAIR